MTTISNSRQCRRLVDVVSFGKARTGKKLETAVTRGTCSYFFLVRDFIQTHRWLPLVVAFPITIIAIRVCQFCNTVQDFVEFYHPYSRDSLGRIVKEGPWTFQF